MISTMRNTQLFDGYTFVMITHSLGGCYSIQDEFQIDRRDYYTFVRNFTEQTLEVCCRQRYNGIEMEKRTPCLRVPWLHSMKWRKKRNTFLRACPTLTSSRIRVKKFAMRKWWVSGGIEFENEHTRLLGSYTHDHLFPLFASMGIKGTRMKLMKCILAQAYTRQRFMRINVFSFDLVTATLVMHKRIP